jgi:NitT/TauT family transport system substrate-binding protein
VLAGLPVAVGLAATPNCFINANTIRLVDDPVLENAMLLPPPLGVEALEQGRIRIVARGSDVPSLQDQTVRIIVANAGALADKQDAIHRFMQAYAETVDWMYADDAALRMYAASAKIPFEVAKRARDEFYPKNNLRPDRLSGVDQAMGDAVAMKFLSTPLTKQQLDAFFQYQLPATP